MNVDQVTLADLEIFADSSGGGGVEALFVSPETAIGRSALRRRLNKPASGAEEIEATQDAVRFFCDEWDTHLVSAGLSESVQRYLGSNIDLGPRAILLGDPLQAVWLRLRDQDLCRELIDGVSACFGLLSECGELGRALLALEPPTVVRDLATRLIEIPSASEVSLRPPSVLTAIRRDRFMRGLGRDGLEELIACVGELDSLKAMGATTREQGWVFPELVASGPFLIEGEGLYHPFVSGGTKNPVSVEGGQPVVFLTGPNMAGKTTYMRAIGLATLLAQVGMGVPASRLRMTPVEVLITGLNPSDNLRAGLSFFFAEVLRVRDAAEHLAEGKRCLVLFDEVFKGTNVKDALDASSAVISGFAQSRESGCVFSSHLVELAEPLASLGRVRFAYFDGEIVDGRATYSYELHAGVSDQRFGLQLLEEANVPALLERIGR
jgi:DNA mismatch repair protein MutS